MKKINLDIVTIKAIDANLSKYRRKASFYANPQSKHAMVLAYEHFSKSKRDSYNVAKLYNIKVCPYCNINYTYVVGSRCRPDFDHFLPKSKHPSLALRVMNLVPCCQQCNSRLKLAKEMSYKDNVHPFLKDFDSLAFFQIDSHGKPLNEVSLESDFDLKCVCKKNISPADKKRIEGNKEVFAIDERYEHHKDVVLNIIKNAYNYWDGFLEEILNLVKIDDGEANSFKTTLKSQYFIKKIIFPDIDCDINSTSLGKMKRDVSKYVKEAWEKS